MRLSKDRYHADRWLKTATEDLKAAELLRDGGMYAQACFLAQQSGEKAIKSLWYLTDVDPPWGHSIQRLIIEFPRKAEIDGVGTWIERAALLDKFYIPTRYPNGLPDLTPGQVYRPEDAKQGIDAARSLVGGCRAWFEAG